MKFGIDFGTTRTVVAAVCDGRHPIAAFDIGHEFVEYLPGLARRNGDAWLYGWRAAEGTGPAIRSIKRIVSELAPDQRVPGLDPEITALELVTGYAAHVRHMLLEHSNLEIAPGDGLTATLAVPANASTRQRYLTIEAFSRAGFEVESLHNEPTAAAVEFAHRNFESIGARSPKRYVVVYDLGGGTFDSAAVSLAGRRFELLASEGIARLGGDDFDSALLGLALESTGARDPLAPGEELVALERCREAKEGVGPHSRKLMIDLSDVVTDEPIVLDMADVRARCAPLIERTTEMLDAVFAHLPGYGIDPDNPRELGGVYLVGGGVQFAPVARALRTRYPRKTKLAPQPHAATAIGLAICADPRADIFVKERTTRHFGVWRERADGRDKVFDRLLSKDTSPKDDCDLLVERVYHPTHSVGALRFLECAQLTDDGQPAGDVTPWTRVLFPYDVNLADRTDLDAVPVVRDIAVSGDEIAEIYRYRPDGTIAVDIENRTRGYRRSYILGAMR